MTHQIERPDQSKQHAITQLYILGLITAVMQLSLSAYVPTAMSASAPYAGILTATAGILANRILSFAASSWILIAHLMIASLVGTVIYGLVTPLPLLFLLSITVALALLPLNQIKPTLIASAILFSVSITAGPLPESVGGVSDEQLKFILERPGAHLFNASIICYVIAAVGILSKHVDSDYFNTVTLLSEDLNKRFKAIRARQLKTTSIYKYIPRALILLDGEHKIVTASLFFLNRAQFTERDIIGRDIREILQTPTGERFEPLKSKSLVNLKTNPDQSPVLVTAESSFALGKLMQTILSLEFPRRPSLSVFPLQSSPVLELEIGYARRLFDLAMAHPTVQKKPLQVIKLVSQNAAQLAGRGINLESAWLEYGVRLKTLPLKAVLRVAPEVLALIPQDDNSEVNTVLRGIKQELRFDQSQVAKDFEILRFDVEIFRALIDFKNAEEFCSTRIGTASDHKNIALKERLLSQIRERGFLFHFQPIHNLRNPNEILFIEGLARWKGPDPLSPPDFIQMAENLGLGSNMTQLLFDEFCAGIRKLDQESGFQFPVSFNLKASDVLEPELRKYLIKAIRERSLNPQRIIIELVETQSITALDLFLEPLLELADFGFKIAIDDFGRAFSSTERLMQIPFHYLKLDGELTQACTSTEMQQVIATLGRIGKGLDIPVIAEAVETQSELECLSNLGLEWGQGYLFTRPADPTSAAAVLRGSNYG